MCKTCMTCVLYATTMRVWISMSAVSRDVLVLTDCPDGEIMPLEMLVISTLTCWSPCDKVLRCFEL